METTPTVQSVLIKQKHSQLTGSIDHGSAVISSVGMGTVTGVVLTATVVVADSLVVHTTHFQN